MAVNNTTRNPTTMKNMKATAIVTLLFAGVAVFFLQTLPGASQATPRAQAQAFPQHYDEVSGGRLQFGNYILSPGTLRVAFWY